MKEYTWQGEKLVINEYEDAESLIMRLSNEYAGDLTLVASGGRGRNKCEYYNYPCSFDIETTSIKPGELDYSGDKNDPPIAFPYLFQWNIYGSIIMCRTYSQAKDIFSWISEYFRLGNNRRMIIFDHNLSYEYGFFMNIWKVQPERCFALDEHHPVSIYTEDGFFFRDSYKMTNQSLEVLSKDWSAKWIKAKEIMDYSQLRTPYSELDENTYIYSALDVLSLSDAIKGFLDGRKEPIWTKCPTSTSFVRKELKHRIGVGVKLRSEEQRKYYRWLDRQKVTAEQFKFLQRAARGGNTHANRKYTGQLLSDLVHYDITSSYPAQMVCYPEYPVSSWQPMDPGSSVEDVELFERNGYCCMFDVALKDPQLKSGITVPYISISKMIILEGSGMSYTDNGRYMDGLKWIQLSIFGIEWDIIRRQYDFSDAVIIRGWFCRKGFLPDIVRKYVLELYARKTELKNVPGKAVEYALYKIDCNSVYGMSFTSPIRPSYEVTPEGILIKPPEDLSEMLEDYQKSVSYFFPYVVGCLVATLGRCYLQRLIDACGDAFVYCDTDSVFALKKDGIEEKMKALEEEITSYQRLCGLQLAYKDIKGREHELGGLSREPDCEYFKTFGAKKYITVVDGELECTIAGVPKKAGSRLIGSPENFQLGFNFKGKDTGKNCLWYNPDPGFILHDQEGRPIEIHSNIAMLPVDYLLSISRDYSECLSIEGNFHWNFKEADKNVINEEDL